jgi:hypothetical protein
LTNVVVMIDELPRVTRARCLRRERDGCIIIVARIMKRHRYGAVG